MRSSASSFKIQKLLFSSSSVTRRSCFFPYLPSSPVFQSPFPPITCFKKQFMCKTYQIQFAFFRLIVITKINLYSYVYPTRCNVTQFIYFWKLIYMFRMVYPPIIRSTYNCIYSIWYLSNRNCYRR